MGFWEKVTQALIAAADLTKAVKKGTHRRDDPRDRKPARPVTRPPRVSR